MRTASVSFVAIIAIACSRRASPGDGASSSTSRSSSEGRPQIVHVASGVQADAAIRTERAAKDVLGATIDLPGEVVSQSDRTARLSSPVAGRLEAIRFGEGATVKKGDALAVLRVPDLGRVRGALTASVAKAAAARADADRTKGLFEKQLATEQSYMNAEAQAAAQEAESKALREQLAAMGVAEEGGSGHQLVLRAPVSGVVVSRDAVVGQPVPSDQTIATIADLSQVWFVARAFERDVAKVERGAAGEVRLTALPGRSFSGSVELVGRALDPVSRSASIRIPIENGDAAIRVAMTGSARVRAADAGTGAEVVSVPRAAVTDLVGRRVVFVRKGPEEFEARDVDTGSSAGERIAVLRGIADGEEVVVDGIFTLKSIALKSTFAEE